MKDYRAECDAEDEASHSWATTSALEKRRREPIHFRHGPSLALSGWSRQNPTEHCSGTCTIQFTALSVVQNRRRAVLRLAASALRQARDNIRREHVYCRLARHGSGIGGMDDFALLACRDPASRATRPRPGSMSAASTFRKIAAIALQVSGDFGDSEQSRFREGSRFDNRGLERMSELADMIIASGWEELAGVPAEEITASTGLLGDGGDNDPMCTEEADAPGLEIRLLPQLQQQARQWRLMCRQRRAVAERSRPSKSETR